MIKPGDKVLRTGPTQHYNFMYQGHQYIVDEINYEKNRIRIKGQPVDTWYDLDRFELVKRTVRKSGGNI